MTLTRLALRNAGRQRRRSLLTGIAIAVAVAAMTFFDAYLTGAKDNLVETHIQFNTGHVEVLPREGVGRTQPLPLDKGMTRLNELLADILSVPDVEVAAPRIRFGVLLDKPGGAVAAQGIAVLPSREKTLYNLDRMLVAGTVPGDSSDGVLLGEILAKELGLKIGDELFVVGMTSYGGLGPGLYHVTGLVRSGIRALDRKTFFVPLPAAQEQLAMEDRAMQIACRVRQGRQHAEEAAARIQRVLDEAGFSGVAAVPWNRVGLMGRFQGVWRMMFFILAGLLMVLALGTVANTVLMAVMERTREIGALRALGFQRGFVVRMIVMETVVIGLLGIVVGLIIGIGVGLLLQHTGIDFTKAMAGTDFPMKPIIYPHPSVSTAVWAFVFGLLITLLAAWFPARSASRMQPARALRAYH